MKKLLQKIQDWRGRPTEDHTEIFERIADQFKQETGFIRPGRSIPLAMNVGDEYDKEREEAWNEWITFKNNELDAEIAQALDSDESSLQDQIEELASFILGLDCGYPKVGHGAVGAAIAYIKELRNQVTTDPRAIGAAGWNTNRKDVTMAGCHRCGVVEHCLFTHDPGQKIVTHMQYWCYKCYMEAKR